MDILQEIYQHKLVEVRKRKKLVSVQEICAKIDCDYVPKNFSQALQGKVNQGKNALICEVKKASPSKGLIRGDFDAVEIAKIYEESGAACISVLTDEKYFQGHDDYLKDIRKNVDLPLLRKDFIVDEYQIYEAKMLGADCILLIVAMLDDETLQRLENCAIKSGLGVLIEVHNDAELSRALKLQSKLIGINNRNLKTMKVDIQNCIDLVQKIPKDYIVIGESGIKTRQDIENLNQSGVNKFLIGEHFMLQKNIAQATQEFL